jgi:hypothetical protein
MIIAPFWMTNNEGLCLYHITSFSVKWQYLKTFRSKDTLKSLSITDMCKVGDWCCRTKRREILQHRPPEGTTSRYWSADVWVMSRHSFKFLKDGAPHYNDSQKKNNFIISFAWGRGGETSHPPFTRVRKITKGDVSVGVTNCQDSLKMFRNRRVTSGNMCSCYLLKTHVSKTRLFWFRIL